MTFMEERYELVCERLKEIEKQPEVKEKYQDYFKRVAAFQVLLMDCYEKLKQGFMTKASLDEIRSMNKALYEDILGGKYEESYANPVVACGKLGVEMGRLLSFLYTEIRSAIPFLFEDMLEELVIRMELFVEVYNSFAYAEEENGAEPTVEDIQDILYWFVSDYSETETAWRTWTQLDPAYDFATKLVMESDFSDVRYLYQYGEYVSKDTEKLASYMNTLPDEKIKLMADTYSEGYRIGFVKGNKDLNKKQIVEVRYILGMERMVKAAIANFAAMGLKPTAFRSSNSIFYKSGARKVGYYGAIPNKQYEYDHKDDLALFLDKKLVNRKLEVLRQAYEENKEMAALYAGPAVIEEFGDVPFAPTAKKEACTLSEEQQKLSAEYRGASTDIVYEYIDGEQRSFTIIAFPVPQIGDKFSEIFDETIKINTLDYLAYEKMQATIIDTLDKAKYVEIKGMNGNKTDLHVELFPLNNPEKETCFENCVADVNIPVGEVFTSPVLEGTNGILHVSRVFLNELEYQNLEMTFEDGKIKQYTCTNFETEEENQAYIKANVLYHYDSLPIGEFAIGTNTTAYMTAKKYDIGNRFPILIAEKTGPHFAVGDTCYARGEDVKVYNENGKEIVARDNSVSLLRKTDPSKAYFGCHTDITIPYDELGSIIAYDREGNAYPIIENGRFVLAGCEGLNEAFDR